MVSDCKLGVEEERQLPAPPPFPARDLRVEVNVNAFVRLSEQRTVPVCIVDLSASGFHIKTDEVLLTDQAICLLDVGGGSEGVVRWFKDGHAGGVFVKAH